ncbi:MAG TPA: cupredoxin domain-containing protein [Candidatus Acidoferrales bacterium]|nr:cupredoxin domain-containing protein [Candidatus Acidoferrales bacterium]
MKSFITVAGLSVLIAVTFAAPARCDDAVIELRFENRRFKPQTVTVPANQPVVIKVTNASKETIEFESFKLNRERVVGPGETITIRFPGLRPGSYDFYDDFHQDVPEGSIVAK